MKRYEPLVFAQKLAGIDPNERFSHEPDCLLQRAKDVVHPAHVYLEDEPTVSEWLKELAPDRQDVTDYIQSLFPSAGWIRRYGFSWLLGDTMAGITIGLVIVPQAMAYALLAQLTPAYGLYTSFTGAVLYWLFGTSRDIVIGTTAVGSLLVGQCVSHVESAAPGEYSAAHVAHALSLMSGAVLLFFGLFRLGWIIEFIPYIPISAFITGASITIMSTQAPTILGLRGINSREAPYKVIIETLKKLPETRLDAAIGISSIVLLFAIREACSFMETRQPLRKRVWSHLSSLRMTFVMLLYTMISWLVNRGLATEDAKFRIVGHIETGFKHAAIPQPDTKLIGLVMPQLPAVAIILVIEHIAIAKAMGRLNNYTINPSQEIVALGAANAFSPFVGGYVCTGSFGASAVLSKAGVRTPLAGLFSALVLILALYALTAMFRYIPNAALAGLIVHAVCNLLTPPKSIYKYWQLSPIEAIIWVVGVVVAIFKSLEVSIYVGVGLSTALLLVRLARTRGTFLGRVRARRVVEKNVPVGGALSPSSSQDTLFCNADSRNVFLPVSGKAAFNPLITVQAPYPGVFVYRFNENYNYTNQAQHVEALAEHVVNECRRMEEEKFEKPTDRLWCDPGPKLSSGEQDLPYLRAVVLDFSAVSNLDITCIQGLVNLRATLDRFSAPDAVEWHFASVYNRWTRRALASAGFGYPTSKNSKALGKWIPAYSISEINSNSDPGESCYIRNNLDIEAGSQSVQHPGTLVISNQPAEKKGDRADLEAPDGIKSQHLAAIYGVNRPFFHIDLTDAVEAAVRDARNKDH